MISQEEYERLDFQRRREEEQISILSLPGSSSLVEDEEEEEGSQASEVSDRMQVDQEGEVLASSISRKDKGKGREMTPEDPPPPYTSSHLLTSKSHQRSRRSPSSNSNLDLDSPISSHKRRKIDRTHFDEEEEEDEDSFNSDYVPSFLPAFPDLPKEVQSESRKPNAVSLEAFSNSNTIPLKERDVNGFGGLSADLEYLNFLKQQERDKIRAAERAREEEREERNRKEEEIRMMHAGGDVGAIENDSSKQQGPSTSNATTRSSPPPPPQQPSTGKDPELNASTVNNVEKDELASWKTSTSYHSSMLGEVQSELEIPSLSEQLKVEEREREKELEKERKRLLNAQSKRGSITPSGSGLSIAQREESERRHSSSLFAFAADYPALLSENLTSAPSLLTPMSGGTNQQQTNAFSQRRRLALTLCDSSRYSPSDTLYASIPVRPSSTPFIPGPSLMITLPPQPEHQEYTLNAAGEMVPIASAPPEFTPTLPNGRMVSLYSSSGSVHPTLGYRHSNQTLNSARAVSSHKLLKLISRSQDPSPLHDDSHAERVFQGRGARLEWLDPIGQRFTNPQTSSLGEDGSANPSGFGIGGTDEDTNKSGPSNSFLAPALNSLHLKRIEEVKMKVRNGTLRLDEEALGLQLNQIPAPERPNNATLVHTWDWNPRDFTDPNLPTVGQFRKVRKEDMKGKEVGFVGKGKEKEREREISEVNTPGSGSGSGSGGLLNKDRDRDKEKRGASVGTASNRSGSQTPASRSSPINAPSPLSNPNLSSTNAISNSSPKESPKGTNLSSPHEESSSSNDIITSTPMESSNVASNPPSELASTSDPIVPQEPPTTEKKTIEAPPEAPTSAVENVTTTKEGVEGGNAVEGGNPIEGNGEAVAEQTQQS